jgi:cyanophycinase
MVRSARAALRRLLCLVALMVVLPACTTHHRAEGTLLLIGGGLDDDNRPVYERFATLASRAGTPSIVIATAASGDQEDSAKGKLESFRTWCPQARVEVMRRETPTAESVAMIDRATAMFFTGGDQKRITDRYRPGDRDGPELVAMRRLLARGGVIAGTSAGDAMMGEVMFHTGRSAQALGLPRVRETGTEDDDAALGPRIGPGMGLVGWVVTDSHFFERNRVGRLVAALEVSGRRLGIGVGEDAAVEIDLASGEMTGVSVADSLLVEVGGLRRREGSLDRLGCRGLVMRQGTRVSLPALLAAAPRVAGDAPAVVREVPVAEPGQNRQLASWRLFMQAADSRDGAVALTLDGWSLRAWAAGDGWSWFDVVVPTPK